jgi:hypothetical protein
LGDVHAIHFMCHIGNAVHTKSQCITSQSKNSRSLVVFTDLPCLYSRTLPLPDGCWLFFCCA